MAVSYVRYKARNGAGTEFNLYVPRWTQGSQGTISRGWKTPNEIEAATANFPFPGTWFVKTASAKTILASMGIINVYVIDDIISSGYAHWDIIGANGLTGGYIEFTTYAVNLFHPLFGTNAFYSIGVYSPESTSQNSTRMHTMPSDQFYTVDDTPRLCAARAQNMRADSGNTVAGLYFYYSENGVPYTTSVDLRLQIEAFYGGSPIPESHQITYHLVHATGDPNNPTEIPVGATGSTTAQFVPENHYTLKYGSVLKTSDNTPVGDEVSWEWSAIGGYVRIFGDVPYDITIEVVGVADPYPIDPSDPTSPPDPSSPNYDFTSVPITAPTLPSFNFCEAGFVNLYNPTADELNRLASYMWSGSFSADNFKKLFASPMEAILGCHIIPVQPSKKDGLLCIGNYSTGIATSIVTSQWKIKQLGTVSIPEYYSAYLSYEPYTKISIYLPFIGFKELSADTVVGKRLELQYTVDVASGACVADIFVSSDEGITSDFLYEFSGNCAAGIPVTQGDYKNIAATIQSTALSAVGLIGSIVMKSPLGIAASGVSLLSSLGSSVDETNKPQIAAKGSVTGTSGYMASNQPYILVTTPRVCMPAEQNEFEGLPIFETVTLADLSGYTVVDYIHPEGTSCTDNELIELEEILKGGVII